MDPAHLCTRRRLQALQRDPSERLSTAELLAHPWITKEYTPEEEAAASTARNSCSRKMPGLGGFAEQVDCWEY
jgi:hypothetical protein